MLVLITGASAGIGRAAVKAFVQRGDRVLALARDAERLAAVAEEEGGPSKVVALAADVTDVASVDAAVSRVLNEFGPPDVVVANAGIGVDALFTDTSDELLRRVYEVNVFGLVRSIRPFVPGMIERGSGRILLVSSVVGKRGIPYYSAYSSSKFALHGLADTLRAELWGSGVTVGLVCPSSTESEFQQRMIRPGAGQKRVRLTRHSAESVAHALVRMAGSRRREMVLSAEGKLLVLVDSLAPGLIDWVLARTLRRKRPAAE